SQLDSLKTEEYLLPGSFCVCALSGRCKTYKMTAREEIVKRCVVVPGVPRTISADHLVKNISIPDGGQVICGAVVEGAESDTNLQRATKLKETQHVQIEVEGESLSFEIVDAVECDIPLQWTQSRPEIPERHHGPINMGPYNPQMNPANFGAVSGYYMNYQPPGHEVVDQAGQPPVSQAGFPHQGPPGGHPGEGGQGQPPPPGFTQAPFGHPGQAMSFGFPHPGQRPPGPGQAPPMPQIIFDQQARMPMVWHPYYGRYVPAPPNMFQQAPQGQGPALEHHSDPQQAGREPQMPHDLQDGPQGPPPPYNSESDLAPETHHTEANENIKAGFEQDSKAIADQDTYMQKIQGKIQAEHEGGLQSGEEDITASKQFEESEPSYETEENCTAVLLRNIPINVHEEYIELFFENKKNFSDVKVSKVAINRQEKTAVVEFEDEEASRIVLEKETIIIKKTMIAIEPYIPRPPTPEVTKEDAVEDDVLPKVVLKDLPDDVDQEEIEMVFQSKKRVGDIELVEIVYNEEDSLAIVTLGNQDSLDTLLEKSPLKICGKIIHVEEYELPNDMDTVNEQPKIFVTGVPEDIDFDDVEMVFENRRKFGDTKPLKIDYNEDEQSIVLTYENESAVDHVLSKCPLKIRGVVVQLEKLEEKVHAKEDISDDEMSEHVVEFDGTQTKILVEDIPESIDVEALEMYFEARKLKCCEVIDVDLDEEDRNAVIEFAKPSHTIIVKGPPDIVNEDCLDSLEMYFDNKRKSGGGGVVEESSTFSAEENAVYLTFEEEEVAKRVVNRGNHKVHKKEIEVTLFKPKRATKRLVLRRQTSNLDSKSSSVKHTEVEQEPVKTIRVRGMKKISSRESVNWYFENKKRAGGGDIENRYTDEEDDDIIYIRFKEEEVANAVAEREHHTVDGVDLAVALYTPPVPPPSYSNKILFKGLNEKITESVLGLFLEARANCNLVEGSLTYHADNLEKLELACNKPLEGSYLKVACVPISNCILVSNISDSATKDMIELYFENNKRSNGGPVSKVEMFKNQGYCLVYFNDYKTVDSVLCKEQKLAGNTVEVKRYIQCIARAEGDSVNRRFRLPEPISISVSQLKKRFTQSSQMAKTALEAQMNMCHATITWSEETPSVELSCSLTTDVKDCIALACNWKNQAEQNFNDFMDKISEQNMPVMEELWEKITPKLADVSLEQPDAAAVYMAKKEGKISVVGMKHVADPLISEIEAIIKSTSDELSKEKQFTRQTITTLRPLETRMLLADKFPIQLKESFPEVEVRINQGKNETIIEGIYQDVNKVLLKMYELKDRFCTKDFQFPTQVLCLYDKGNKTVKDYIVKKLKNSRVVAVWENTGNKLIVMAVNKETLDTASKVVRESVLSKTVLLSEANISVLQTDAWVEKKRELTDKYREKLVFDTNDLDKLVIGTTDDIANEVVQNIQSFLRAHSILKDTIKVPKNVYKLLKFNHVNDIHTIASSLQSEQVRIFSKDDAHVIEISGTKHGMEQAKSLVETLLRKVIKTQHQIRKPGLREYMQTEKGIEITRSVESTLPCVISMNDDSDDDDDMGNDKICVIASCTGYETRRMFAAVGDMSEINVDVIVNPSDDKIGLSGGLGRILKMKGGQALERPCRDYIENNGRLSEGEVFVSPAGNLKAKYVIHVIGPVWNGGTNQEDDKLTEVVFKAMKQASLKNMKSLAMPAISCGVYGFPVKKATGIIVAAVKNFFREEQDSSLTEIYLCDMKDDTVDAFTEALQKEWGDQNVKKHASQRQRRKPGPPLPNRNPGETVNDVQVGNITISVVKDEIAKFKTPVIVNTTAKNLDLNNGAVSKTILRQAGKDIQKELKQKYPDGLSAGEIAVTSGYNMDCSHVLHGAVMNWDGKGKAIEELKSFVKKCLQETDKRKLTGVAFPAIGTGNLGYPRDIVADEMFDAVADFANNNPQSTITKVAFILYPKDVETIKAFEEKRESFSKGFKGQKKRERQYDAYENLSRRSFMKGDSNEEAEHIYEELPVATFADSYSFGSIKVTIKSGDITGEDAECIVNSSNEDLDFKRGKVSQALMKKCGKALLDEANSKKANMKKHEVVITKAPNLKCSNIMHVVAKESPQDWKQIVVKCLDLAKKEGYNSLAFPALGTGMSAGVAAATAQVMVQATKEFAADGCGRLTDVRFVIFQKEMVDVFNGAVRKAKGVQVYGVGLPPPPKTSPGMFGKFNGGTDAVLFTLWALEQKNISAAIDKLERGIEREISKKEFTDTVISRMDDKQLKELKKKAEENKVEYKLKDGTIQIVGVMPNVVKVTDDIYNCLRDAVRIEQDQNAAMILKDVVQWYWIEQTEMEDDLKPYKSMLNYQIEQAFKAQKDKFTYIDQGDTVVVDFKDYTEYYESKPSEKDTILRKDLIKEFGGEVPANWKAMKGNLLVYKMVPTDQEYTDIAGKFSASSGAGFTIHAIEKVQNKSLWLQYEAKKKQLEGQNPPGTKNEQFLWHGTSEDTVDSVNAHATAYGDGVYFAVQASYSCSNTYSRPGTQGFKRVYYCAVLTGVFDLGKGGMRVPPPNPKGGKNALFDSVVNNVANPGMYIIFNDTQAYPLYIVTFKSP
ncbi:PAR14-like protein, partial [Mya arenaria]